MLLFAAGSGIVFAQDRPKDTLSSVQPIEVTASPIAHFERSNPERRQFGKLQFRGGLVLTSSAPNFGGWSGLVLDGDGRLLAISDAGAWMTAELRYDGTAPKGLTHVRIGPLLGVDGRPFARSRDRDSESVALLDGNLSKGTVLVSFERNHRIGRFRLDERGLSAALGYLRPAPEWRNMKSNRGLEAVGVIRGGPLKGTIMAFSEEYLDPNGNHTGWLWTGGPSAPPQQLNLRNIGDFAVTDVASTADGSLIVLERWFRWTEGVKMRLRRIKAGDVRPGALLEGETLFEADMAYEIDNMEGLSVHAGPAGETMLTLVSDDNFNHILQRTVLLQFTLVDRELASKKSN